MLSFVLIVPRGHDSEHQGGSQRIQLSATGSHRPGYQGARDKNRSTGRGVYDSNFLTGELNSFVPFNEK